MTSGLDSKKYPHITKLIRVEVPHILAKRPKARSNVLMDNVKVVGWLLHF